MEFVPNSIDGSASLILVGVSLLGAFITAAAGIGGGIVLLAVMATLMPTSAVIPVHGAVQIGANGARAALQRAHIDWRTFVYFGLGSVVGIGIGGSVVVSLPADILRAGLALFILYTVWGPKLRMVSEGKLIIAVIGLIASFLTMFFGATGTFIAGLLNQRGYTPREMVATHSVCMGAQHILKVVTFAVLGFAFAEWVGLIALMMLAAVLGTYLGSLVLNRLPAETFAIGIKAILTLLSLNLLATAAGLYRLI